VKTLRRLKDTIVTCLACCSGAYGDDCDPVFVASETSALESETEYMECKLDDMQKSYTGSSQELIEILDLLKDQYEQSLIAEDDDADAQAKVNDFVAELDKAKSVVLTGDNIDLSAADGAQKLERWVKDVHKFSKDPKRRIDRIDQDTLSGAEKLTICKASLQWKKSRKWHDRLIQCVNKLPADSDEDGDSG
jgi:hypothetical protein